MEQSLLTRCVWKDTETFYLYKNEDTSPLELSVNDFIYWEGREEGAKIVKVLGMANEVGPRGFTYLPWRKEGRWATPMITLRGDARFIICYPSGVHHYGQHIPLHTITKGVLPTQLDTQVLTPVE